METDGQRDKKLATAAEKKNLSRKLGEAPGSGKVCLNIKRLVSDLIKIIIFIYKFIIQLSSPEKPLQPALGFIILMLL